VVGEKTKGGYVLYQLPKNGYVVGVMDVGMYAESAYVIVKNRRRKHVLY
jgi:hypothetical protein